MELFNCALMTRDGCPAAVTGFCVDGAAIRIRKALTPMEELTFGPYTSAYTVDYRLGQMVETLLAPVAQDILLYGAVIETHRADGRTGGILSVPDLLPPGGDGRVFSYRGFLIGCRPGALAFALMPAEEMTEPVAPEIRQAFMAAETREDVTALFQLLRATGQPFFLIADGSGPRIPSSPDGRPDALGIAANNESLLTLSMVRSAFGCHRQLAGKKRIGILGGSFSPIHLGHLLAAEAARDALALDHILLVPTGRTIYKQDDAVTAEQRYWMAVLAAMDTPDLGVSDLETANPGLSFTCDTARKLGSLCDPDAELVLIMGSDAGSTASHWKGFGELAPRVRFAILNREGGPDGQEAVQALRQAGARAGCIPMPPIGLSSTDLRDRIAAGRSIRFAVPRRVAHYIALLHLYERKEQTS